MLLYQELQPFFCPQTQNCRQFLSPNFIYISGSPIMIGQLQPQPQLEGAGRGRERGGWEGQTGYITSTLQRVSCYQPTNTHEHFTAQRLPFLSWDLELFAPIVICPMKKCPSLIVKVIFTKFKSLSKLSSVLGNYTKVALNLSHTMQSMFN